jgi:hypothetical protein
MYQSLYRLPEEVVVEEPATWGCSWRRRGGAGHAGL